MSQADDLLAMAQLKTVRAGGFLLGSRSTTALVLVVSCWLLQPSPLAAQADPDPSEGAPYLYGAIAVTPGLVFSAGHDTNVYREPTGSAEFETFVVPQVQAWWKQPGFRVQGLGAIELIHFGSETGAPTTNYQAGVRFDRTNALFKPYGLLNRRKTYAAATGYEIGYKSNRLENAFGGGASLSVTSRSDIRFGGGITKTRWDADAIYSGSSLNESLNHDSSTGSVGLGYAVTPLTTVTGDVLFIKDRFIFSPERDGNTTRLSAGLALARPATLSGSVSIGYQHFSAEDSGAADFNGMILSGNIGWANGGTSARLVLNRDVEYSFDAALGYYVITGFSPTVTRQLAPRFGIMGFFNHQLLDYTYAQTANSAGRKDTVIEYGGALIFHTTQRSRLGWTVEHAEKDGDGGYQAFRTTVFLTYGSGTFQRLDRPTPLER